MFQSSGHLIALSALWLHVVAIAGCADPGSVSTSPRADAERTSIRQTISDTTEPLRDWKYVVLHHTATTTGDVDSIDNVHKQRRDSKGRPWRGIGYHFVIGNGQGMPDGAVEATFRWTDQLDGAHAGSLAYNQHGIGICLVGNFEDAPPTPAQLRATYLLMQELGHQFALTEEQILRHGDLKATACPGRLFPYAELVQAYSHTQPRVAETPGAPHKDRVLPVSAKFIKEGSHVVPIQSPQSPRD